jgi:probable F420-dependent oxidoreductase
VAVAPPLEEPPPTVLAALGPQMTALAATRTHGPFPYNVTPEHTAQARASIGPDPWLCVEQKVLLVKDPTKARGIARQAMAFYLPLPSYQRNWQRLGFREEDLANGGSDRFLDAMVAWGDEPAIRQRLQAHVDAGASHVCINPCIPTGSLYRTLMHWPPSPPSRIGACLPAACRMGLRTLVQWLYKIRRSNPSRRFADTPLWG